MGSRIAANQITNGGPIILVQVRNLGMRIVIKSLNDLYQSENEYSGFQAPSTEDFTYESELMASLVGHSLLFV